MNTLLDDWRRFIRHGFRYEDFSDRLYRHLATAGGFGSPTPASPRETDKRYFWTCYFEEGLSWLIAFIEQFGGSLDGVEDRGQDWIDRAPDLNRALIEEMQLIYPALVEVLLAQEDMLYHAYKQFNLDEMATADGGWNAEQWADAAADYDRDFYDFGGQEIFDYDGVDDDLRDRLARAVAKYIAPNTAATLFEARRPVAASASPPAQETLFTARRARRRDHRRLTATPRRRNAIPAETPAATISAADVAQYMALRAAE